MPLAHFPIVVFAFFFFNKKTLYVKDIHYQLLVQVTYFFKICHLPFDFLFCRILNKLFFQVKKRLCLGGRDYKVLHLTLLSQGRR